MKTKFSTPILVFFICITFLYGQEKVDSLTQLENEFGAIDSRKHILNNGGEKLLNNFFVRPSTSTLILQILYTQTIYSTQKSKIL